MRNVSLSFHTHTVAHIHTVDPHLPNKEDKLNGQAMGCLLTDSLLSVSLIKIYTGNL